MPSARATEIAIMLCKAASVKYVDGPSLLAVHIDAAINETLSEYQRVLGEAEKALDHSASIIQTIMSEHDGEWVVETNSEVQAARAAIAKLKQEGGF